MKVDLVVLGNTWDIESSMNELFQRICIATDLEDYYRLAITSQ